MPGRPPKPTALKILQGNPGGRPLNEDEPKPELGAVIPAWFATDPVLVAEWKRHEERLTRLGLLTEIDDDALATLCVLEVRFRDMVAEGASPLALAKVSAEKRALWSRFGMTPADRVRVKVSGAKPKSKLEGFRGKVGA